MTKTDRRIARCERNHGSLFVAPSILYSASIDPVVIGMPRDSRLMMQDVPCMCKV